jgi:hypothetical protein
MIVALDRHAWATLSRTVATDLAPIFETGSTALGPEGVKMADSSLRKLSLSSSRSVQDVANVVVLLDTAGQHEPAINAAESLRRVPFTGNQTVFEPIRQAFALAFRRLTLHRSPDARVWEPLLSFAENGGEPGPVVIREATARRLNGLLLRRYWRADLISGSRGVHVANVCAEIRELVTMWALGGSATWTRPTIDDEIAGNIDALRRLGGIKPANAIS